MPPSGADTGAGPTTGLRAITPRVYLEFAKKTFQKQMQYRVANVAGLTTNFFFATVRIFVFSAFYAAQTEAMPLNLAEVTTYICLTQAFLMVLPVWGRSEIAETIKDGSIAMQLTKPVDFHGYWFANEFGKSVYYTCMRALPTFFFSKLLFDIMIPLDASLLLSFTLSMSIAAMVGAALHILVFGTVFWTLDSTGVHGFAFTLTLFFSGFLVPISLWPEWLQDIAQWLPFECLVDLPFNIYLGKTTGIAIPMVLLKQLGWLVLLVMAGRLILRRGFSKLVVQGG